MHKSRKHLVVAERDARAARDLRDRLTELGFRVTCTQYGSDVLWRCEEGAVDLVVLDTQLHDMDGLDVCGYLRESARAADTPILMLTEPDDELTRAYARQMVDYVGADYFLAKPYDLNVLIRLIVDVAGRPLHDTASHKRKFPTRVTWPTNHATAGAHA